MIADQTKTSETDTKNYTFIDCDVHHILPNFGTLMEYLEPGLRRRIELATNARSIEWGPRVFATWLAATILFPVEWRQLVPLLRGAVARTKSSNVHLRAAAIPHCVRHQLWQSTEQP